MKGILTDLDNDLIAEEAYSGITRRLVKTSGSSKSSSPTPNTSTSIQVSEQTAPIINDSLGLPLEQENLETMPTITDEDLSENIDSSGGMFGGGGSPQEEEVLDGVVAREEVGKILGLDPKLFYGGLALVAIGGYIYFKKAGKI